MAGIVKNPEYKKLLKQIKTRIQSARIKAAVSVNVELLTLYWDLAKLIVNRQKQSSWGDGLISLISNDLKIEFPDMKGFSPTNLKYMRNWYLFWAPDKTIARQFVSHLDTGKEIANLPQFVENPAEPLNCPQLVDDLQHDDIPYENVYIGDFLERIRRPVKIEDGKEYQLVTVRLHHKGVTERRRKRGSEIRTNKMYEVRSGDFILSGIDARNGAFGIVPDELDRAVVQAKLALCDKLEAEIPAAEKHAEHLSTAILQEVFDA